MYLSLSDLTRHRDAQKPSVRQRVATTVVLLGLVSLLTDISSEMVSAVLPLYLTTQLGLGLLAYGFVDGLYQGSSALVRVLGGYLGDRGGTPKYVAVVGYGVSALSRLAMLPATGLFSLSAVVFTDRLGKGLRTAPRDAIIAASSEPAILGRSFGVHRTLDTIGAAIGPVAAFALLALIPQGYSSIFVVSFLFALVGLAVLVVLVPNVRTRPSQARVRFGRVLREITARRLRRPLAATAVLSLLTVGDGFLYLAVQSRDHLAASLFPLLYVGTNLAYLVLAIPLGRLADRVGRARVMVGGHIALLGSYLVASRATGGPGATILTLALLGTFYAATDGVLSALISRLAAPQARGAGIAAAQTVVAVARFVCSLGFGALWLGVGRGPALLTMAALLTSALPVAAWLIWPTDRSPEAPADPDGEEVTGPDDNGPTAPPMDQPSGSVERLEAAPS